MRAMGRGRVGPISLLFGVLLVGLTSTDAHGQGPAYPNRPITINANVVVDIRGLKQTANSIEDMVAKGRT